MGQAFSESRGGRGTVKMGRSDVDEIGGLGRLVESVESADLGFVEREPGFLGRS
jgi:hypothetical protein